MRHYGSPFGKAARMLAISAFAAALPLAASAQPFNKQFDNGETPRALSVRYVNNPADPGFIMAGDVQTPTTPPLIEGRQLFTKTNPIGLFQWSSSDIPIPATYPPGTTRKEVFYAVRPVPTGGYVAVGGSNMLPNSTAAIAKENVFATRVNATGGVMWRTIYGGMEKDVAYNVEVLANNYFILTGIMDEGEIPRHGGSVIKGGKLFLMKLDPLGVLQFCTKVGATSIDPDINEFHAGYAVHEMSDGSFVAVGSCSNSNNSSQKSMYVVKVDAAGNVQWAKTYNNIVPATHDDAARGVKETSTGEIIVAGTAKCFSPFQDVVLMKLNPATGIPTWVRRYWTTDPLANRYNDEVREMYQMANGDLAVVGLTDYWQSAVPPSANRNPFLAYFNMANDGSVTWSQHYPNSGPGNVFRTTASLDYIPDIPGKDGFVIASDPGTQHLIRTDMMGQSPCDDVLPLTRDVRPRYTPVEWGSVTTWCQWEYDYSYAIYYTHDEDYCTDPSPKSSGDITPGTNAVGTALLSPNPVQSGAVAGVNLTIAREAKVEVRFTDMTGNELFSTQSTYGIGQYTVNLPTQNLAPGVYIAHIIIDGARTTQKLVVVH